MLEIDGDFGGVWPVILRPRGENNSDKEAFPTWWKRVGRRLSALDPLIAEQWVFRHWTYTEYRNLALDRLSWDLETWPTSQFLQKVSGAWREDRQGLPALDYDLFHALACEPALTMDSTGTWNIPPVILSTPAGVRYREKDYPNVRHWLIEGHQRRRYLRALHARREAAQAHAVFVLRLQQPLERRPA